MSKNEVYRENDIVPENVAALDEVEAIREAKQDIANGDLYTHEEVWG